MTLTENHQARTFVPGNLIQVILIHVGAIGIAPFLFTWDALFFAIFFLFLFSYAMGICHHMLLTHRSFRSALWLENIGGLLGTLTWRGPFAGPVRYVAMHRVHHQYSDTDLDPHSPIHGKLHALLTWYWNMPFGFTKYERYAHLAPDLTKNRWHVFLDKNVHLMQIFWGLLCFIGGTLVPRIAGGSLDPVNGLRYVVYGVCVRALLTIYLANAVDLVNHTIGYRNYETEEKSTNSYLMAFVHGGGAISWHNNHHAHMGYFTVRKKWWEIDVHYYFLCLLERLNWVGDIRVIDEVKRSVAEKQLQMLTSGNLA